MARGGKREGSGRKQGAKNKTNAEREAAVAKSGLTPLDYLLQVMRAEDAAENIRIDAAKAAAPYVHPKLANIQVAGDEDNPITHRHDVEFHIVRANKG